MLFMVAVQAYSKAHRILMAVAFCILLAIILKNNREVLILYLLNTAKLK